MLLWKIYFGGNFSLHSVLPTNSKFTSFLFLLRGEPPPRRLLGRQPRCYYHTEYFLKTTLLNLSREVRIIHFLGIGLEYMIISELFKCTPRDSIIVFQISANQGCEEASASANELAIFRTFPLRFILLKQKLAETTTTEMQVPMESWSIVDKITYYFNLLESQLWGGRRTYRDSWTANGKGTARRGLSSTACKSLTDVLHLRIHGKFSLVIKISSMIHVLGHQNIVHLLNSKSRKSPSRRIEWYIIYLSHRCEPYIYIDSDVAHLSAWNEKLMLRDVGYIYAARCTPTAGFAFCAYVFKL